MTSAPLLVVATEASLAARARALAASLGAPVVEQPPAAEGALLLELTPEGLQLRASGPRAPGAVSLDFSRGRVGRRRQEAGLFKTPLARAVGVTRERAPLVLDGTAGLGTDSALLAWMGCRVLAVERSPVLGALWRDALGRLAADHAAVADRLAFEEGDARDVLARLSREGAAPDVVYLDPMFPARGKRALVKKEMQLLHALHGASDDDDAAALLDVARATARLRVVVKRPKGSPPLAPGVTHAHPGSTTRLDVYVVGRAAAG